MKQEQGDLNEARRLYEESLQLSQSLDDNRSQAISLHQLGVIAMETEKYDQAEEFFRRSLEIKGKLQDRSGMADTLHQLGLLFKAEGKNKDAEVSLRDALGIFNQLASPSAREVEEDLNTLLGVSAPEQPAVLDSAPRPSKAASKKGRTKRPGKKGRGPGGPLYPSKTRPGAALGGRKSRRASAKSYR